MHVFPLSVISVMPQGRPCRRSFTPATSPSSSGATSSSSGSSGSDGSRGRGRHPSGPGRRFPPGPGAPSPPCVTASTRRREEPFVLAAVPCILRPSSRVPSPVSAPLHREPSVSIASSLEAFLSRVVLLLLISF